MPDKLRPGGNKDFIADAKFRVVVVGDEGTGKTSLISRLIDDSFPSEYTPTVGIDFAYKHMYYGEHTAVLHLWDTSGQKRFRELIPGYMKDADAALIVFDVTSWSSFMAVPGWVRMARRSCGESVVITVIATKADCASERKVTTREGCAMAAAHCVRFAETSALAGHNIRSECVFQPREKCRAEQESSSAWNRAVQGVKRSLGLE